jgi:hypothetical protein
MQIIFRPMEERFEKLLELYPPVQANKLLPQWYKDTKLSDKFETFKGSKPQTIKDCPAIQDFVTTGFVIRLWGHFYYHTEYDDNNVAIRQTWDFTPRMFNSEHISDYVSTHGYAQHEMIELKKTINGDVLKFKLPYSIEVPEGYNVMFVDPFYHERKDIRFLSGIIEQDKWSYVQFPFEILKDSFMIEAGSPLILAIPYKREQEKLTLEVLKGNAEYYKKVNDDIYELFLTTDTYRKKNYNEDN